MLYVVAASAEFLFSFVVATCCIIFLDSPNDGKHSDTPSALSEASAASLARRLRGKRKKEEREERQEGEEALRAQLSYFSVGFPLASLAFPFAPSSCLSFSCCFSLHGFWHCLWWGYPDALSQSCCLLLSLAFLVCSCLTLW